MTLLSDPPTDGVNVTWTIALAFGANGPRLHVTSRPVIVHAPWLDVTVPAAPSADSVCVSVTFAASVSPVLVTVDE